MYSKEEVAQWNARWLKSNAIDAASYRAIMPKYGAKTVADLYRLPIEEHQAFHREVTLEMQRRRYGEDRQRPVFHDEMFTLDDLHHDHPLPVSYAITDPEPLPDMDPSAEDCAAVARELGFDPDL
jgi:hypothetical protein